MQKPPHQLDYRSSPPRIHPRSRWEIGWQVWALIAGFCGFVELAAEFSTNGRSHGGGDAVFNLVFAVIGVTAAYIAMVQFMAPFE